MHLIYLLRISVVDTTYMYKRTSAHKKKRWRTGGKEGKEVNNEKHQEKINNI